MRLQGKTAFITGGNSGIGLATTRVFVAEGARVAITGRKQETLDAVAKEFGDKVLAIKADVNNTAALEKAVGQAAAKFGSSISFSPTPELAPTPQSGGRRLRLSKASCAPT
jgi:NAD(P)-dependent dehydrogenase (short-subunit alcohol dehydrogenase family)